MSRHAPDRSARSKRDDGELVGIVGARFHLDFAARGFDEEFAGGDVPEADRLLDVGVEPAAGDVGQVERGAAHEAAFARAVDEVLEQRQAGSRWSSSSSRSRRRGWRR